MNPLKFVDIYQNDFNKNVGDKLRLITKIKIQYQTTNVSNKTKDSSNLENNKMNLNDN